jgi:hypothetical protein
MEARGQSIANLNQMMEQSETANQEEKKLDIEALKANNVPEPRDFQPTAVLQPTPLNYKRIQLRVSEGALKSGGLFSASYFLYRI